MTNPASLRGQRPKQYIPVTARNEAVPHFTERASKRVTVSDRRDLVRFKNYNKKFISTKKGTS